MSDPARRRYYSSPFRPTRVGRLLDQQRSFDRWLEQEQEYQDRIGFYRNTLIYVGAAVGSYYASNVAREIYTYLTTPSKKEKKKERKEEKDDVVSSLESGEKVSPSPSHKRKRDGEDIVSSLKDEL